MAAIRDAGSPARGLFLAPWLLDGAALDAMTAARAQDQLTVASPIDLQGRAATAYLTALGRRLPAQRPSLAGLASFIATATGRALPINGITLYSPAQVSFLPPSLDAGHDAHGAGPSWLTAGDLLVTSTAALG